ncbi:MAG: hypothetical protein KAU60_14950 [Desulfobacterales bacterium]|nr:hypothetical protein [Desulfobacterales bacterium]
MSIVPFGRTFDRITGLPWCYAIKSATKHFGAICLHQLVKPINQVWARDTQDNKILLIIKS